MYVHIEYNYILFVYAFEFCLNRQIYIPFVHIKCLMFDFFLREQNKIQYTCLCSLCISCN